MNTSNDEASRPLDSDQLGKHGELLFAPMCVAAGLIPNPCDWDRKGWDYLVAWPRDAADEIPYDKRASPLSCLAQIKTVWEGNDSIRVTLSAIEHLAKDMSPAFIVVFVLNEELSVVEAHVAHIAGDFLARILEALRRAHVEKQALNEVHLSFALSKWFEPCKPQGREIRRMFEASIGSSMPDYVGRKQEELRDLGFDDRRTSIQATLSGPSREFIADAIMGLHPIEARDVLVSETRFGISIPIPGDSGHSATIKFEPQAYDRFELSIGGVKHQPFKFRGEVFRAPRDVLLPEQIRWCMRTQLLDLILTGSVPKGQKVDFNIDLRSDQEKISKARLNCADWFNYFGFFSAVASGPLEVSIEFMKTKGPIAGRLGINPGAVDASGAADIARIVEQARAIFDKVGWPGTKLSLDEIWSNAREVQLLYLLITQPGSLSALTMTTDLISEVALNETVRLLYIDYFTIGRYAIAYAASTDMILVGESDQISWQGRRMHFVDAVRLSPRRRDYNKFVSRLQQASRLKYCVAMPFRETRATQR